MFTYCCLYFFALFEFAIIGLRVTRCFIKYFLAQTIFLRVINVMLLVSNVIFAKLIFPEILETEGIWPLHSFLAILSIVQTIICILDNILCGTFIF